MPLEEIDANAEASSALGLSSLGVSIGKVSEKPNEDEDQEEVLIASNTDDRRTEEQEFDEIVGLLEDTLCDDAFQQLQDNFCLKHCGKPGNKLELCCHINIDCIRVAASNLTASNSPLHNPCLLRSI